MGFTSIAIVAGLVVGLLAGGRPRNAARHQVRWPGALLAGVALQWVPELLGMGESSAFGLVLASYAALVAFGLANVRLVGMPVVLVGLALNVVVIAANGGMPVRDEAVVAAGGPDLAEVRQTDFGAKRHLEGPDDRLTALGDIIPVAPLREVLSFGDLVLAFGVADVVFRLLKPTGAPGYRRTDDGPVAAELDHDVAETLALADAFVVDLVAAERHRLAATGRTTLG